jgi:hypothetical protein
MCSQRRSECCVVRVTSVSAVHAACEPYVTRQQSGLLVLMLRLVVYCEKISAGEACLTNCSLL